uniref:Membrane protein C2G11.09 n=1 Tax=Cajanus cajan TaxID=3821 RepID=A0A151T010_CAJCA|nr:putative membrane protein C2G11.09 [Cajanus cajan]
MILSALLTSVGINLGLCFLFFTLYSILRKQPGNITVYAPRLVAEGKVKEGGYFNLERLLPTAGWVRQAWEPSEDEFLSNSGLDAFVFMRIFIFSLKVFAVGGIIGMSVLLPINYMGSQLSDDSDFQHKSLDSFSISNVNNGSNSYCNYYIKSLCNMYRLRTSGRDCSLCKTSSLKFVQFKFFTRNLALELKNCSVRVYIILQASFFYVHFQFSKLWIHFSAAYIFTGIVCYLLYNEYWYLSSKRIAYFYSSKPQPHQFTLLVRGIPVPPGSTCHETVERFFLEYHPSTYLSHSVVRRSNKLQSLVNDAEKLYKRLTHLKQKNDAPKRHRRDGCLGLFGRKVDIDHYERRLGDIEDNVRTEQSSLEAKIKRIWSNNDPEYVNHYRVSIVFCSLFPLVASFFISYVVTSGWTTIASELFQLTKLISNFISRIFGGNSDDDFEPPSIPYHSEIPRIRLFGLLGVTYFILAPLIIPFLLIYFCLGYIIFRNQLLKVYVAKYETGGQFWPTVHNSTIFSLILMHIIAIGIFGLKKLPLASILTLPLPILTLLFNEYCQKRFFPTFKDYPAECLIKKDRADENEHNMPEFYDKLANAYNDPALMPKKYSERSDSHRSPLLHSSE